jgi:glycosyltransferase involved in cell wall biosynthesis
MLEQWAVMRNTSGATDGCPPAERHDIYRKFLHAASSVEVPTYSTRDIFLQYFPEVSFNVVPHQDHLPICAPASQRPPDGCIRVAIVGAIGPHKGLDVLIGLARDSVQRGLNIKYTLIGYSSNDDELVRHGVSVRGRYSSESEAIDEIGEVRPDFIFIPSIWPETFCYVLSIALKLRIPPIVFNLGAQGERLTNIPWSVRMPPTLATNIVALSDSISQLDVDRLWKIRG